MVCLPAGFFDSSVKHNFKNSIAEFALSPVIWFNYYFVRLFLPIKRMKTNKKKAKKIQSLMP